MKARYWGAILLSLFGFTTGQAMTWQDGWVTPDQQAAKLWNAGEFSKAAQLFQREDWRAAAAYRAGDYQRAAQNFLNLQTLEGNYNAGNAFALAGQYQAAIAAYDKVLHRDPQHTDALFNREIVQKLLDQQQQKQSQQKNQNQNQQSQSPQSSGQQPPASASPQQPKESSSNLHSQQPKSTQADSESSAAKSKHSDRAKSKNEKAKSSATHLSEREQQQAKEQWLRLIPDDPAYLLREKFLRDHLQRKNGGGI